MKRWVLRVLVAVVLLIAVAGGGVFWWRHATFGATFDEDHRSVSVAVGDRFSVAVPDRGPSVGDHWSASATPAGLVAAVGERTVMSSPADVVFGPAVGGGGGTTYFIYTAERAGTADIKLSNCFQSCDPQFGTDSESRSVTWNVTVG